MQVDLGGQKYSDLPGENVMQNNEDDDSSNVLGKKLYKFFIISQTKQNICQYSCLPIWNCTL